MMNNEKTYDEDWAQYGYLILRAVRGYLDVVMYENLEVHTEETIENGRKAIERFGAIILVCTIWTIHLLD